MPLQIPSDMFQVKLRFRLTGDPQEMITTIGLKLNEAGGRDINLVAKSVYEAWTGAFDSDFLNNQWSIVGADASQGMTADGINGSYDEVQNGTGTDAGSLPQNCAMLVKKKTNQGGKWNSGRMFVPSGYLPDGDVSNTGIIASVKYAALQSFVTAFYENLVDTISGPGQEATSYQPVLFHNNPSRTPTDIASLVLDPIIATQRQRLRR